MGDSLLVVGDETALKVHVHTDDPGAVLTVATAMGVVEGVEIANMHQQTVAREERLLGGGGIDGATGSIPTLETGLVAVCPGRGNRRLFESLGATRVIEGGQTMNPSAADIVDAIEAVPTDDVLVLPNNSNVVLTAEQAAALSEKNVRVIPSRSVQAGLAAMTGFVPGNSPEENERAMLAELEGASTGEVTVASRDVTLDGVDIREGAYLGLVDDVAVVSDPDLDAVVHVVVDRVLAGGKGFLTILTGEGAPPLDGLVSALEERHPGLEVDIHDGGQPHYPLLLVAQQ
jgi:dihydroxyacetone kinase-like predicted kinase